jgi:hypothetical protein
MKIALFSILLFVCGHVMAQDTSDYLTQIQTLETADYSSGSTIERTQKIRESFLKIHNFTYNYGSKILFKLNEGKTPNGHELNLIHESLSTYIKLSSKLNQQIEEIKPSGQILRDIESQNALDELHWLELKAILLSNYKNTFKVFFENKTLRRIIKDQMDRESYGLGDIEKNTNTILNTNFAIQLQEALDTFITKENDLLEAKSDKIDTLSNNIKSTVAYKLRIEGADLKELASQRGYIDNRGDSLSRFFGRVTNALSLGFGSVAGNISWREGYLRNNEAALTHIKEKIRPLDLLLEKRGYVFTDFTIPGNWGHVAVYLGTEAELRAIGMWNDPAIIPYQQKIKDGFTVFQVRRWGLEFVTLKSFMNLDEIAILRHKNMLNRTKVELGRVYNNLFDQIGKKYDFGFDALSTNEITCTEIVSLSFGDVNWPTAYTLGRVTISPDDMAKIALFSNTPVEFVTYIKSTDYDQVKYNSVKGYASVMRYRTKKNLDGSLRFDEYTRKCTPQKRRVQGGLRLSRKCETEWKHHSYSGETY